MFYVSWNHKFDKIDLGKTEFECQKCGGPQQFTVRLYTDKTKLYGLATIRKKRFVTCVCHGCLTEYEATKEYQEQVIANYDAAMKEEKEGKKVKKEEPSERG